MYPNNSNWQNPNVQTFQQPQYNYQQQPPTHVPMQTNMHNPNVPYLQTQPHQPNYVYTNPTHNQPQYMTNPQAYTGQQLFRPINTNPHQTNYTNTNPNQTNYINTNAHPYQNQPSYLQTAPPSLHQQYPNHPYNPQQPYYNSQPTYHQQPSFHSQPQPLFHSQSQPSFHSQPMYNMMPYTNTNTCGPVNNTCGPVTNTCGPVTNTCGPVSNTCGPVSNSCGPRVSTCGPQVVILPKHGYIPRSNVQNVGFYQTSPNARPLFQPSTIKSVQKLDVESSLKNLPKLEADNEVKREEDIVIVKITSALASKLVQLGTLTGNLAKNKLTGMDYWFKVTSDLNGLEPPPNSYVRSIYESVKSDVHFTENQVEQLWHIFRFLCLMDNGLISFENLMNLFTDVGPEIRAFIRCLFTDLENDFISFKTFIVTLSILMDDTKVDERLIATFTVISRIGEVKDHVNRDLLSDIISAMVSHLLPYYPNKKIPAKIIEEITELFSTIDVISQEIFLEKAKSSVELGLCCGLYPFILDYTIGRLQNHPELHLSIGWIPFKEGFLLKRFKQLTIEKWSYHWCVVSRGTFYYYNDLKKYETIQRSISLADAKIEKLFNESKKLHGVKIILPEYSRAFLCDTEDDCNSWIEALIRNTGERNKVEHQELQNEKNFHSTFPPRSGVRGEFFVDGMEMYSAVLQAILGAQQSIFLADWFFSCEVYLNRQDILQPEDRLDNILKKKAEEGVKVCILLWNETKIATTLNSEYVQYKMEKLHPNIHVQRHPLSYPVAWSHHQKIVVVDQDIAFVGGLDLCFGRYDDCNHKLADLEGKVWPGKDYYNPAITNIDRVEKFDEDSFDRTKLPRMPWHDVHVRVEGDSARDVSQNFIERWNFGKISLESISAPFLKPKTEFSQYPFHGTLNVQLLRSLGNWHLPNYRAEKPECSIYNAYLYHIKHAKKFIYIENQYFISSTAGDTVKNEIAQVIVDRIIEAIENKQCFRVVVILPVHPEGSFKADAAIRYIMKWQFDTIKRGKKSIIAQLKAKFPEVDPEQYITFHSLRKAEEVPSLNTYFTEQIYIHSKLMIVDDSVVIVGSANINDRSMLGDRDSEIAVAIEDENRLTIKMNGETFEARAFAFELRKKLWAEHLGLKYDDQRLDDPTIESTYNKLWLETSKSNTEIFKQSFPDAPGCHIAHLSELSKFSGTSSTPIMAEAGRNLLERLRGHLVQFPIDLLSGENLIPDLNSVEVKIADADIFT